MKQRKDYTFKYNETLGRHGWLRLTPAYSVKLVKDILGIQEGLFIENSLLQNTRLNILDPFCGTATTGIVASEFGFNTMLFEINPFLVWFGNAKASNYSQAEIQQAYEIVTNKLTAIEISDSNWIPPMKNIHRWWSEATLLVLAAIRKIITDNFGEPSNNRSVNNLIWIAFARLCIECSAADFGHVSVSFKDEAHTFAPEQVTSLFVDILNRILNSAAHPLKGRVTILNSDSRNINSQEKFDMVITSPPYPNRMSYIRELRPYMYWLKFLNSGEEAGELDWKAIGGTWGSATSRLSTWNEDVSHLPSTLLNVCKKIETSDEKNGLTMSKYVLKFFFDLNLHLSSLRSHLNSGARINYILGNSSFYGNMVDTDNITKEILLNLGYHNVQSTIIRKRNCKKELYEYMIHAEA